MTKPRKKTLKSDANEFADNVDGFEADSTLPSITDLDSSELLGGDVGLSESLFSLEEFSLDAADEAEWIAARERERLDPANLTRKRKAVVPPEKLKKGINLMEYLSSCQPPLDKKIIDISIAQTGVPSELRDDAAQEIRVTWTMMKPDIREYKPGQIAAYAHRVARHTALRVRRDLGSAVRLPGSAFRKKKDGSTYVTPGLLAAPLQWEELEGWLDTDDAADSTFSINNLSPEVSYVIEEFEQAITQVDDEETETMNQRLSLVNAKAHVLSPLQRDILIHLITGDSYESIQNKLKLKRAMLLNEIEEATAKLYRN